VENNVTEKNNSSFSMSCLREQHPSAIILKMNYKINGEFAFDE